MIPARKLAAGHVYLEPGSYRQTPHLITSVARHPSGIVSAETDREQVSFYFEANQLVSVR